MKSTGISAHTFAWVISTLLLTNAGCATIGKHQIASLDVAEKTVIEKLYQGRLGKRALFAHSELKKESMMIGTWPTPEKVRVPADSWFFFIDEMPDANWEHPAKIVLVEKETGKVHTYPVGTPPREISRMMPINDTAKVQAEVMKKNALTIRDVLVVKPVSIEKKEKYAILVSGGWDAAANYGRYWNDLSFIYKTLKTRYNYKEDEIIVLYANGTHAPNEDLDGDGLDDIDNAATKDNLTNVMQQVADNVRSDGTVFFYSTNHGGYESGHDAYLYLWGETIRDDEFAALTKKIKSEKVMYVMEQCYSGGMMDDILTAQVYPCTNPRVCVVTAAKHDEVSYSADSEGEYDEYVYHFTSAMNGQTPGGTAVNADGNGDGVVSLQEAHEYAKGQDSRPEHPVIGSCVTSACGSSLFAGLSFKEDCVSFNPATTVVQQIDGRWKVVDGNHWLFDFGEKAAEARQTLSIIKHYGMSQSCFVGRPDPSFHYLLVSGAAPNGGMRGEDCITFNPATTMVKEVNGSWKIADGSHWLFDFGTKKDEAQKSLEIIVHYGFDRSCFVGRPGPSFQYLRK